MSVRGWRRVSQREPCAICRKPDWCTVTADGGLACCMRVESGRPARNGGWLHGLGERRGPPGRRVALALPARPAGTRWLDAEAYHRGLLAKRDAGELDALAELLGVAPGALDGLAAAWDESAGAWAFPMRDGAGRVVGIRLRAEDGRKWAVRGSREGLFYRPDLAGSELFICEGPTDTAAGLSLGLPAVGRPSCAGAVEQTVALCRRLRVRQVTVIADNDPPHRRPDGAVWYPGREGTGRLVRALGLPWRLVLPPAKDLRAWVKAGAPRALFETLLNCATWREAHGR